MKSFLILSFGIALSYGQINLGQPSSVDTLNCPYPNKDSCASYSTNSADYLKFASASSDRDATARTPVLIKNHGYAVQEINVTTKDGYILTMYRIPSSLSGATAWRAPVLIMHGLVGASHDWELNPADANLPYMLANQGHDVYIGNNRGTTYSQGHTTLKSTDLKYWDFSWHEMGIYDVPAFMDKITQVSRWNRMYYVGLSEGTSQFFVMSSLNATYTNRIILSALLAPVAYLGNATSPVAQIKHAEPFVNLVPNTVQGPLNADEFLSSPYAYQFCSNPLTSRMACANFMFFVAGFNSCEMNCSRVALYTGHDPDESSLKNIYHYGQIAASGKFRQYDKRPITFQDNIAAVDADPALGPAPADYPVENISCKIALFSGSNDILAHPKDVARIDAQLRRNGVLVQHIKNDYEHLDFYWGLTVKQQVFTPILNLFRTYTT